MSSLTPSLMPVRSTRLRFAVLVIVTGVVAALLTMVTTEPAISVTDPCAPGGSKIACENSKPGSPPSEWDIDDAGDESIQGFATDISVNVGQKIDFKIDTDADAYTIDIYRVGYYQGEGARRITGVVPSVNLPQTQPECITELSTELYDCGNWAVSASWNVPSTAVSGVYFARLNRADTEESSHITFVVRDDASHSDVVFQTSDTTWQAYNTYGGSDFYRGGANGRAYKLSYNRPMLTRNGPGGRDFFFANEYPMVRFMERNGYDVSYIAGVDTDRRGALLTNHKTFLSVGHDEYWSAAQRANVTAARDAGVNLMFLSGNEMYWKVRYEASSDTSRTAYRTLVSYKETWANAKIDPSPEWTGTWRDPRYAPRSRGGGQSENALIGTQYQVNHDDLPVTVSAQEGKLRLWRNTPLASMAAGTTRQLAPHTIGYESNEDVDNGMRPGGLIHLSTTTGPTPEYLRDFGNTVTSGTTTHNLTMYRAASGALVFSAGSVQWSWGLDSEHDSSLPLEPADARMQQAQVNLFADMGVQPATLATGLVASAKSTDSAPPTVAITAPAAGSAQGNGSSVTVSGTAEDSGGGVVAGVEVSLDGGATWHAATGTSNWSYSYVQHGIGNAPIQARAMDDSANKGPIASRSVNVSCPCSVFGNTVPATPSASDTSAVELGLRFTPASDGFVTGVRFYKGPGNSGSHTGSLWSSSGQRLANVTFTGETTTGWQSASFTSPVAVAAGSTYVVSYTAPNGRYATQAWAFSADSTDATPLLVDGGFGAAPAGVHGAKGTFPNSSFQNTNYFVDVAFTTTDTSALIGLNHWPLPDSTSVPADTTLRARFSKPLEPGSEGMVVKDALGNGVAGSTTYDAATRTITFTPNAPLNGFVKYTATLSGRDTLGNPVTTNKTWSFTTAKPPAAPGVCPCTLFDDTTLPTVLDSGESAPVTLGVRFASSENGLITGIRFYKAPGNTGTHVGTLWSMNGTPLATGTFAGESTSGWQTLTFATPVKITKDTEYLASYKSPTGSYSLSPNGFAERDLSRSPLRVAADSGAFTYADGVPGARSASNYMVDPVFERPVPSIAIASQDPAPGAVGVPRGSQIIVGFTNSLAAGYSLAVSTGGTAIAGTTSLVGDGTKLRFTPSQPMPKDALVSVALSGVRSVDGAALADQQWTYRTDGSDDVDAPQSMFGDEIPVVQSATNDASSVEVGAKFTPAHDGKVTSIRFFKGPGNGGIHVGSLWNSTGTLLGRVTFTNESASGWQTAKLDSPVTVNGGSTYVVSYLAPQGHYSYTANFLLNPWVSGDLTAPGGPNGLFLYGSGGFPQYSWKSTNYFVDVIYVPSPPSISVVNRSPATGADDVLTSSKPSISFSSAVANGYDMKVQHGTTPVAGTVARSTDGKTLTFSPASALPADASLTVTVSGVVSTRGATLPTESWTFRTEAAPSTYLTMFDGLTPTTAEANDASAVELGTAFTPSVNGKVTAIRFYKGPGNTGTHTGSIWSSSGTRLGTVTFTNETSSGWQTATLPTPVALTAGNTYVVSYHAPNGRYSVTGGFFNSPWSQGPLSTPTTNNGRYAYGASGTFPSNSWNATNYFVGVVFRY